MTTTAFGPQGPNYSTTRPSPDPEASAGVDTWFVNCSAPGAKDGTYATASFFNVLVANLRYLVNKPGVTLNDADDTMVYQAVKAVADAEITSNILSFIGGSRGNKVVMVGTVATIESTLGDGSRVVLT